MRLEDLLAGVEATGPIPKDLEIESVSYDTRTLRPGGLFVALRGYESDGHRFIPQAWEKGAAAVIAQEGEGAVLVPDSRRALARISANWFGHPERELPVVGVTGTNGKTTVTTLLAHVLQAIMGLPVGLMGTNEVRIGERVLPARRTTPESYEVMDLLRQMTDCGCACAVMEVSSHALCLDRVAEIPFAVGAFTNLTQDHLDFHKTMEAYRQAKARLFAQSDRAVVNVEDEAGRYYLKGFQGKALTYSRSGGGDLTARNIRCGSRGVAFDAVLGDVSVPVEVNIPGDFTVSNALCVLGCAYALGLPLERAAAALANAPGPRGRMELAPHPGPGTVVIDYAHTPYALQNALMALRPFTPGRLICLFGCGGDRDRGKRPLMGAAAAQWADICVVTSDNPRSESPDWVVEDILRGMVHFHKSHLVEPDREKAIRLGLSLLREGDTLLLAGKGHETYQEVQGRRRPMDEREIVKNWEG